MRKGLAGLIVAFAMVAFPAASQLSPSQNAQPPAMSRGKYIAIAADCAGCHANPERSRIKVSGDDLDYSGGLAMLTPMGTINAPNITGDRETGIGSWTLAQFTRALRQGVSPKVGPLYPAMPYPSYSGMSDADVAALFKFLTQEIQPIRRETAKTDLGWPFIRPTLFLWNALFLPEGQGRGAEATPGSAERGDYLVNTLGHCGACHSGRGIFFQTVGKPNLAGSNLAGWYAPNITPHKTGIGDWTDAELAQYLTTGFTARRIAGGEMGAVVSLSLSRLPPDDIRAIVAYLRSNPAVKTDGPAPQLATARPLPVAALEPRLDGWRGRLETTSLNGAQLYVAACATCHGIDGDVGAESGRPSLVKNSSVRDASPGNLIQIIAHGNNAHGFADRQVMPAHAAILSNAQIAALATHVRNRFGGIETPVTEQQVDDARSGLIGVPWLLLHAYALSLIAIGAAAVGLVWLLIAIRRRRRTADA